MFGKDKGTDANEHMANVDDRMNVDASEHMVNV